MAPAKKSTPVPEGSDAAAAATAAPTRKARAAASGKNKSAATDASPAAEGSGDEAAAAAPATKVAKTNPFVDMTSDAVLDYVDEAVDANFGNLTEVKTGLTVLRRMVKKAAKDHTVLAGKVTKLEQEVHGSRKRRSAAAKDGEEDGEKKKRIVGGYCVISESLAAYLGVSDPNTVRPRSEINRLVFSKIAEEGPAGKMPKVDADGNPLLDADGNPIPNGKTLRYDSKIGQVFGGEAEIKAKLGDKPFTGFNVNKLLTSHIFTRKDPAAVSAAASAEA
jgi:hypothetical protein